ncbi:hypothetical protein I3842_08G134700 [Carya illinoinensis]|uniref:Uncharacterized protein n=1 Tax=Carya illinoinensis TaxID=32201 RepID=A0A922EC55_CARIL|nr:hypothetical protein I3842_08G134700 [Carya illinoinensis]
MESEEAKTWLHNILSPVKSVLMNIFTASNQFLILAYCSEISVKHDSLMESEEAKTWSHNILLPVMNVLMIFTASNQFLIFNSSTCQSILLICVNFNEKQQKSLKQQFPFDNHIIAIIYIYKDIKLY